MVDINGGIPEGSPLWWWEEHVNSRIAQYWSINGRDWGNFLHATCNWVVCASSKQHQLIHNFLHVTSCYHGKIITSRDHLKNSFLRKILVSQRCSPNLTKSTRYGARKLYNASNRAISRGLPDMIHQGDPRWGTQWGKPPRYRDGSPSWWIHLW